MADWYISSAVYAGISAFVASHAYNVGDFVKPTAPAVGHEYVFRCTTAGTSATEPAWPAGNNATITSGGATFTNVSGQSTYSWSAPAGTLYAISNAQSNRPVTGDRVFLSSDHSETISANLSYGFNNSTGAYGLIELISVNRAGSVPPVAGDITNGASLTLNSTSVLQTLTLEAYTNTFWQGITFNAIGTSNTNLVINNSGIKGHYFKNCAFAMTTASICRLTTVNAYARATLDNTTVQFGNTSDYIGSSGNTFELTWINTPSAIAGSTFPTGLFSNTGGGSSLITCRGVDLSAITGTLVVPTTAPSSEKVLLDSCRIASGVIRYGTPAASDNSGDDVELVNCYDGTNVLNERSTPAGSLTTDRTTYLTGGAQDDVGNYSLKLVSSAVSDFAAMSLNCFVFDVENTVIGASKTATVEIISSASLNNNDIRLLLEYMGTAGNPIASFGDSLTTVLTAAAALPSSSSTWNSPPATPQKQLLQVTFTPQRAGRVRGLVRLGKPSVTVWVNPQIAIT